MTTRDNSVIFGSRSIEIAPPVVVISTPSQIIAIPTTEFKLIADWFLESQREVQQNEMLLP